MHVVVVGCGRVGTELSVGLERRGHTVAIVDRSPRAFRRLPDSFGGVTVLGVGFDRDTLAAAGVERAGGLVAVTSGDNSNILAARIAREHYGVERVVARIYDPRRAVIYQRLGVPTVATVAWTTEQVLRRLLPGGVGRDWIDPTGQVALIQRDLGPTWIGRRLAELPADSDVRLAAVTRFGRTYVARDDLVGQEGDVLYLVVADGAVAELDRRLEGLEGEEA